MVSVEERRALTAAERLADLCAGIVGAAARSVILHGSLSAGGLRPGRSDIDLLAVVDGGLADAPPFRPAGSSTAAFMVLAACRIWRFAVENVHGSKTRAAEWALDRDPFMTVVQQAVRQYVQDSALPVDEHGVARLLDIVLHETAWLR